MFMLHWIYYKVYYFIQININHVSSIHDVIQKTDVYHINPYQTIYRFPRIMFTAYNADYNDTTRWNKPMPLLKWQHVRAKYMGEFKSSKTTCQKKIWNGSHGNYTWIHAICQQRQASFCPLLKKYRDNNNNTKGKHIRNAYK
jgi:hypothetical protein